MRALSTSFAFLAALFLFDTAGARSGEDPGLVPRGEALIGELRCLACHADAALERRVFHAPGPVLADVGARLAPEWMRAFLADPAGTKPGTPMPDVLAHLAGPARDEAALDLVHYLAALGGPLDVAPEGVLEDELEPGRQLFHEVGCVACHAPEAPTDEADYLEDGDEETYVPPGVLDPPDVPLVGLERKTTVAALARYLVDPVAAHPDGRMPGLRLAEAEARALARYLLRDQAGGVGEFPGLTFEYFEDPFREDRPDFDALAPVRRGTHPRFVLVPGHRPEEFGYRFCGSLAAPARGSYTFYTSSDDGSMLYVDGELVVDNAGEHGTQERSGTVELDAGAHTIEVTFFERHGGEELEVRWEGPGFAKEEIAPEALSHRALSLVPVGTGPFAVDPARAARGGELFVSLGCAACHEIGEEGYGTALVAPAPALAELALLDAADGASERSCLAPRPRAGLPRYALSGADRAALADVLAAGPDARRPLDGAERITRTLAHFRCYACHRRDDVGGPHPARRPYFLTLGDAELGDEGRIPPHLTGSGGKLHEGWMRAVLLEGASWRPYMATRMPQFGRANVEPLVALFQEVDGRPADLDEPEFSAADVENGRLLTGTGGLGCIQCHTLGGYDSLGVPAVDLAGVYRRIKPRWFHALLADPLSINMNTRMPVFWEDGRSPVKDIHSGDPEKQIDALWTYLSMGPSMPLPDGLAVPDDVYEVTVGDAPRLVGVFMSGVSPRTICVGFPQSTHYAYDVQGSRLAKVWRGRFFNARGTWHARAGELELPPGEDAYELPRAPLFARLADEDAPWPKSNEAQPGYRVLGRRFDAERRPIFRYAIGGVEVEELVRPELRQGGSWIVRELRLSAGAPVDDLWMLRAEEGLDCRIGVDEEARTLAPRERGSEPERRRVLLRPTPDGAFAATLTWEFTW